MAAPPLSPRRTFWLSAVLPVGLAAGLAAALVVAGWPANRAAAGPPAPELDGGVAWLNTAGPLKLADLKGKVVLLDFWTLCCINCIHVMPDLAKLEQKYANQLVVVGVHSPKFETEKATASIRSAVLRYEIAHPVVNDAGHKIWDRFGVNAWPTLVLIGPDGRVADTFSGEGNLAALDRAIGALADAHRAKGTLDEKPVRFDLVKYREAGDTPLFFPGKVLADAASGRLFVADSTHHRVVVADLGGRLQAVAGAGQPGFADGPFAAARFDDPQGMALVGDTLYVADRKNHAIRALDLKARTVSTVAGTGAQDGGFDQRLRDTPAAAKAIGLNSPWDLLAVGRTLFVAMAGHHQIWALNLGDGTIAPFAGDGRENIKDGPRSRARFAQPSGLAADGKYLYVADSEVSAVRRLPLDGDGPVDTLVGRGLFQFGDVDGPAATARLQHALGVAVHDGKVLVADTYNSKLKLIDPAAKTVSTFVGDGPDGKPQFAEPAGISVAGGKAYVADTNAHRIRVVDLATKDVSTLTIAGLEPPAPAKK